MSAMSLASWRDSRVFCEAAQSAKNTELMEFLFLDS